MEPNSSRLRQNQKEEQVAGQHLKAQAAAREFTSVEEMLREDAAQTMVPNSVEERLKAASIEPPPDSRRPWWKRLMGQ